MAQWTTAYIDSLPDSSFAYINGSVRKLPYKDKDGNVDLPHVRDALSRLDQTQGIPEGEKAAIKAKLEKALGDDNDDDSKEGNKMHALPDDMIAPVISPIKLDANGDLPTRFPVFVTGNWPDSIKGNFKVALDNLKRMKEKFDAGIGFPTKDASTGLAANFGHDRAGPAGAWVKGLELEADEAAGTATMYAAKVEYTDEGEKAIRSGRYKCISPEGAFGYKNGALSAIPNQLNLKEKLTDVITGFGFTNMPYLSEMAPVKCSATADDGPLIFIKDKENDRMNLDALRIKENKDVTSEERQFLTTNKDKLSADELKRFGLDTSDTLSAEDRELLSAIKSGSKKVVDTSMTLDSLSTEDRDLLTAIRSGNKKVVDADALSKLDKLDALEATAEAYRKDKATELVLSHVKRGAIKPDQEESTTNMLLSADDATRKTLEAHLSALPDNELLAGEVGHSKDVTVDITDELKQKTLSVQKEAKANGEMLSYAQAQDRLMRDDADIKARYQASKAGK
jgi:hypothetical protein